MILILHTRNLYSLSLRLLFHVRPSTGWAAVQSIGNAVGGLFGGLVLTLMGNSGETVNESSMASDDDGSGANDDAEGDRMRYTRLGFVAAFLPAAAATILSALILWPLRKRLRPPPPSSSRPSVHSPEAEAPARDEKKEKGDTNGGDGGDDSALLKEPFLSLPPGDGNKDGPS